MFDWNDQDQVGDMIWGEFNESEDHIVPYPKGTGDSSLLNFGDHNRKQKCVEASTGLQPTEHKSVAKNEFPSCNLEDHSTFKTNEQFSAPRLDMDSWPDLPSLTTSLSKGYNDETDRDSMATELMNDFTQASNLSKMRVQLDGDSETFGNDHNNKESDSFLDCDWANIGDFDDLDRIFSNSDSIFGHEMVGNAGEFLSPSSDVIGSTTQSIPLPDMLLSGDRSSDQGCSSFPFNGVSGGKGKPEEATDLTGGIGEETESKTSVTSECSATCNQIMDKSLQVDAQKKLLKSQKKAEERSKIKSPQSLKSTCSHNINQSQQYPGQNMHTLVSTPIQASQSPVVSQQRQAVDAENTQHLGPSSQFAFSGHGFSAYPFQSTPLLPHNHAERSQTKLAAVGCNAFPDLSKLSNSLNKPPDVPIRSLTMSPQEKIEKLKRRQQMQAMLAIQQQQQQFGHQNTGSDNVVPQAGSSRKQNQESVMSSIVVEDGAKKLSSSDMNLLVDQDESQSILTLLDDSCIEETIYNELQGALGKLDITIRLCIRDSLFRLAQSARERQSDNDRSSTNKSNRDEDEVSATKETTKQNRCARFLEAETNTNPIDRTVAHLLFHRPSVSCTRPVKEETPQSPVSFNPASKMSVNTDGTAPDEQQLNSTNIMVQPSV